MSRSFSFASKVSRLILGYDDDNSNTLVPESPALFLTASSSYLFPSFVEPTIVSPDSHSPQPTPPGTTRQSSPSPISPISSARPPLLSSTPLMSQPNTQQLALRMVDLRSVDGVDAVALKRENVHLQQENESLKSEVTALRLQHEDDLQELSRLRLLHSQSSATAEQQQQQQQQQQPHGNPILAPVISKKKRKKKRKKERERAAAETTLPPGCTSLPSGLAPTPPQLLQQQQHRPHPSPKLYIFHDSNLKNVTAAEIKKYINNNKYDIDPQETFTLPQTFNKIKQTKFGPNDAVIINILTNDARQTQHRNR